MLLNSRDYWIFLEAGVSISQSFTWNIIDLPLAFEKNLDTILKGEETTTESEDIIGNKVFRTRMVANCDDFDKSAYEPQPPVKGVWGLIVDVTDMKDRAKLEVDNARLMAEEQAAKDSNRMKSQFLANVSLKTRCRTITNQD